MRNFTLLAAIALCTAGATAQAPHKSVKMQPRTSLSKKAGETGVAKLLKARAGQRKAGAQSIWRPGSETFYMYEEGEWLPMVNTTTTYDAKGNPLVVTMDEDGWLTRYTYAYNANGMEVSKITEEDESGTGEEYANSTRTLKEYDPVVTDFVVSKMEYNWDDVENDWGPGDKQSQKRTVTRDAAGRVTSVETTAYFSYTDSWDIVSRTDITYDEATGKASTFSYRQADDYDVETGKILLGEPTVYANIEWENTDGQLVSSDFDEMIFGANRFKKADCYEGEEFVGTCTVAYTEGKEDFTCTYLSTDGLEKTVTTYTTTDENGSYVLQELFYMDNDENGAFTDDECEKYLITITYDEQGNETFYEERAQFQGEEETVMGGTRRTYTYDPTTKAVIEMVQEEYMPEEDPDTGEMTGDYEPMSRITYADFIDVVAGIRTASTAGTAARTVHNLQGMAVGTSVEGLPAGIYIVKEGTKTYKMMKK